MAEVYGQDYTTYAQYGRNRQLDANAEAARREKVATAQIAAADPRNRKLTDAEVAEALAKIPNGNAPREFVSRRTKRPGVIRGLAKVASLFLAAVPGK